MVKQLLLHQREANLSIMLRDSAERRTVLIYLHRLFPARQPLNESATVVGGKQGQPEGRERATQGAVNKVI